jgi:hypothetical protein
MLSQIFTCEMAGPAQNAGFTAILDVARADSAAIAPIFVELRRTRAGAFLRACRNCGSRIAAPASHVDCAYAPVSQNVTSP